MISGIRKIIFDHALLPSGGADLLGEPEGHLHGGEHPAGRADQARERRRRQTTTAYEMEEARMLEEKTVRSSMEQWGQWE